MFFYCIPSRGQYGIKIMTVSRKWLNPFFGVRANVDLAKGKKSLVGFSDLARIKILWIH